MYDLRVRHLQAQCRLLQILKSTPDRGLLFKKKGDSCTEVYTYVDYTRSVTDGNQLLVIVCSWVET